MSVFHWSPCRFRTIYRVTSYKTQESWIGKYGSTVLVFTSFCTEEKFRLRCVSRNVMNCFFPFFFLEDFCQNFICRKYFAIWNCPIKVRNFAKLFARKTVFSILDASWACSWCWCAWGRRTACWSPYPPTPTPRPGTGPSETKER